MSKENSEHWEEIKKSMTVETRSMSKNNEDIKNIKDIFGELNDENDKEN